jgi:hypothetical protein
MAAAKRRPTNIHAKVVPVSTKENFRRPVPKTYSYRYEVGGDAGPADDPLVKKGAAIIEGRYRGRAATWNIGRSMIDPVTYLARGSYIHPLEENPMAYPPRSVPVEVHGPTPGFPASNVPKVVRTGARIDSNVPPPKPGSTGTQPAGAPPPGAARRPTPANEPAAFRKTGTG